MKAVAILVLLLLRVSTVNGDTLPNTPKAKIEAKAPEKNPGLLRSILQDRPTMVLAAMQSAAATADIFSTVHWERKNRGGYEVGFPFRGGRPGVPAMAGEALIEISAAGLLAHEMRTSRFKVMRVLSFMPQSFCITTHAAGARRNYVLY